MLPEPLWGAAADAGLEVVTLTGHDLDVGFNDPANHSTVSRAVSRMIDDAASASIANVIVFSGKRGAADDAAAIEHCVTGLAPLAGYAENAAGHAAARNAEQQDRSSRCAVRPQRLGTRGGTSRRFARVAPAIRLLSHADHGRRSVAHAEGESRLHRAHSYRRRAGTARPRRPAGSELARHRGTVAASELCRVGRARVHSARRSARRASAGVRHLQPH